MPTKDVGLHAFRHGLATELADASVPLPVLQRQLRHADVRTTLRIYSHLVSDTHRECMERLADQMTPQAQLAFLSKLDGTAFPPQTVFIFTANDTERLQDRFLSRCMTLPFSSHGMAKDIAGLLENIWRKEAGETADKPNFLRAAQDSKNNVRDAVNSLQVELLAL